MALPAKAPIALLVTTAAILPGLFVNKIYLQPRQRYMAQMRRPFLFTRPATMKPRRQRSGRRSFASTRRPFVPDELANGLNGRNIRVGAQPNPQ